LETAAEIGHRVSRTFVGKTQWRLDDFLDGKKTDDVIGLVGEVDRRTKPIGLMRKPGYIPLSIIVGARPGNAIVGSAKNPNRPPFSAGNPHFSLLSWVSGG
jgi:hypothetical protein